MKNTLLFGGVAIAALIGIMLWFPPSGISKVSENVQTAGVGSGTAEEPHTVIVVADGEAATSPSVQERACGASSSCKNGVDGIAVGVLKSGVIPTQPTTAVVQTDTNCDPDVYGISHCSNILRLANGNLLEVRHDHNMQVYPCLDPGETVTVEGQSSAS